MGIYNKYLTQLNISKYLLKMNKLKKIIYG